MATRSRTSNASTATPQASLPVATLILTLAGVMIAGLAVAGGGLWYAVKSGHLSVAKLLGSSAAVPQAGATVAHTVTMEPILVNLADPGGHAYLKLGLTLVVEGGDLPSAAEAKKGPSAAETSLRDSVLEILGEQTGAALLEAGGKDRLKQALQQGIASKNPSLKVHDLYFTDFLVQM